MSHTTRQNQANKSLVALSLLTSFHNTRIQERTTHSRMLGQHKNFLDDLVEGEETVVGRYCEESIFNKNITQIG